MAVCDDYKIAHAVFLGWDADDRDKAIWWHVRKAAACRSCGTRPEEWDPESGGDRRAYVATTYTCRGCQQLEARRDALTGKEGRGVHVTLTRPEPEEVSDAP